MGDRRGANSVSVGGDLREGVHLEYIVIVGKLILKWIFKNLDWGGAMDWITLAQDRNRWRSIVITVMSLRVP